MSREIKKKRLEGQKNGSEWEKGRSKSIWHIKERFWQILRLNEVIAMDMNNSDYQEYVKQKAKNSPIWKNMTWAFFVGGFICIIGQGLFDFFRYLGLEEALASSATSMTLIALAALLTGFGIFDDIAKRAGAGTLVPITGFANAMVAPALEFRSEGVITGTAVKLFTVAGPVLVFGISASILVGLIKFILALF